MEKETLGRKQGMMAYKGKNSERKQSGRRKKSKKDWKEREGMRSMYKRECIEEWSRKKTGTDI